MFPGRVAGSCERTRRRMTPKKLLPIDRLFPKFAERERAKRALVNQLASMSTEALGLVIEEIDEGVLIADAQDPQMRLIHVNRAFETITGYSRDEAIGKNCRYLQGTDRLQPEIAKIGEAIANLKPIAVTLRNYRKDGRLFWNSIRLFPLPGPDSMTYIVGLIKDVTDLYDSAERIDRAEHHDYLTGCLNRYTFIQRFDALSTRSMQLPVVVKINVAQFQDINTSYGFDVGDALLQQITQRLQALGPNLIARIGGNEFAIACHVDERAQALAWLNRIGIALGQRFTLPGASIEVRFAIGFVIGQAGSNALSLLRQAGTALHQSRGSRLREVKEFDAADQRRSVQRQRMTNELQHAVANGEFLFHYQPRIDLRTGAIIGAEALLRWNHGVFGIQPPDRFIELAEDTGLILEIGHWGRCEVARFAAEVNRHRQTPLHFSVNIAAIELTHRNIVASVHEAVEESNADPAWLTLELTERMLADDTPQLMATLNQLRELKVGLSVDDFGVGYSSFRYIDRYPLTEIKIDKGFVGEMSQSPAKRIIIGAIIEIGRELNLDIVAEGIETEAQRDALKAMNCPFGQGYLFGAPVEPDVFKALVMVENDTHY
ncbi:MAG: diguanylate cyclase [Phyllobacteriaceae bacterium]|nr:diguanylate cyclase [Phyllobacteriaceae bacterium]MBA90085.1 diguanylate cyclase [Phyllobacteriaceae bacterium]